MPYDKNNMFGVLADQELMSLLTTRGRSKQFEKELAQDIIEEEEHLQQTNFMNSITQNILPNSDLLTVDNNEIYCSEKASSDTEACTAKSDQAVDAIPVTPTTPVPNRNHLTIDTNTTPRPKTSGKPSHRRRRDLSDTEDTTPPTPSTLTANFQPREYFIFTNEKQYKHARALFATMSQPQHPSSLRWNQLAALLTSPPIGCEMIYSRNSIEVKVIRPARTSLCRINAAELSTEEKIDKVTAEAEDNLGNTTEHTDASTIMKEGPQATPKDTNLDLRANLKTLIDVEKRSVVLHKPHGGNPWVEKHVLDNMATAMMAKFGWEKGNFVTE